MGPGAGHDGRSGGRAYGSAYVGVLEDEAPVSQGVEVRRVDERVAVTGQSVRSLLVGEDEQYVRTVWHDAVSQA